MATDDADLEALQTATRDLASALAGVGESDWGLSTPCADWSLRDLVDHVAGGNWYTIRILAGDTSEDALAAAMASFGGEPPSAATAVQSAVDQFEAFESAEALDNSWNHVAGELPGRQILRLRLHDVIVHTWDINEARRPPASIPKSLAEWGLGELENPGSLMSQHFNIPPAPGGRPLSDDASAVYLRAFGR